MDILQSNIGGFNFDNTKRNAFLSKNGCKKPNFQKTGTTICGIVFKDGVCLAADTRATNGTIVADKNCLKIHKMTDTIYCCGAGTAADCDKVTNLISSQLKLHSLETGARPRVVTCITRLSQRLFSYQGYISAALVVGGVDSKGAHLHTVFPHGSTTRMPYATMGSGSLAAMAVFEAEYKDDMDEKEAIQLVDKAIQAGIFNDLGSGSNVDVCIIKKEGANFLRNIHDQELNRRHYLRKTDVKFPRGSTTVIPNTKVFVESVEIKA